MRRVLPFLLPLVLAGCGGGGSDAVRLVRYPALGTASIDLAFEGSVSPPAAMRATGAASGLVTIASPAGNGHAVEVEALVQGASENGTRVDRRLDLFLDDPGVLAQGVTYALDASRNVAIYSEARLETTGPDAGLVVWGESGASPGGKVTVESLSGGMAVLRIENVAFPFPEGTSTDYVLSGTISGKVVAAYDLG